MNQHKETIRVSYSFDDNETLVVTKDIKKSDRDKERLLSREGMREELKKMSEQIYDLR